MIRTDQRGAAVGLIRKTSSMLTLGAVDFRSNKERTARYTRQTRNAVRAQSQMLAAMPPAAPPPGWYRHPADAPNVMRWFDGRAWSDRWQYTP